VDNKWLNWTFISFKNRIPQTLSQTHLPRASSIPPINLSDGLGLALPLFEGLSLWVSHRSDAAAAAAASCIETLPRNRSPFFRSRAPRTQIRQESVARTQPVLRKGSKPESVSRCSLPVKPAAAPFSCVKLRNERGSHETQGTVFFSPLPGAS